MKEKNDGYKLYCFWWNNGFGDEDEEEVYLLIKAEKKVVEKLLNELKNKDPDYNIFDWFDFLDKHGIKWKELDPDYYIEF
jgi:hypothetical protein